ncbi:CDAN1-interacting nuclease 1-like [Uloborus diversus]|uniref:CDAN1-interacting nuclease 1-like n=1 Tax=Uloborus diversus TaxID=327109 RepID=UPI002409D4B3|nr:CDAN1-interacting nuclease 1-like [Uloborus diversus]
MKRSYYKKIIEKLNELRKRDCLAQLSACFPDVSSAALESIIAQEIVKKTKKTTHYHLSKAEIYYKRYLEEKEKEGTKPGFLLKLADKIDFSPALLAKLILEQHFKESKEDSNNGGFETASKFDISEMLKNSTLIDDPDLAVETRLCILSDETYGCVSDVVKNSVGEEFETKLQNQLTELGLSYSDENQLRKRGYDKTPDIILDIPIAIDDHVVNWIESKASFGDDERHEEYLKKQYKSYYYRFGPGLVIYWAGFIDELNTNHECDIIISDTMPTNITRMDPSLLMKRDVS